MNLYEWIESQRDIDHRFSLKELAKKLKIHPTTLSRTISKTTKPKLGLALEIEKVTKGAVKASDVVEPCSKFRFCECGKMYKLHR
jgi:DNA-binding transcriptional regulator YdaS (Cro superfamily)